MDIAKIKDMHDGEQAKHEEGRKTLLASVISRIGERLFGKTGYRLDESTWGEYDLTATLILKERRSLQILGLFTIPYFASCFEVSIATDGGGLQVYQKQHRYVIHEELCKAGLM